MSEAFESYKLHTALKLHFTTPKYDFVKFKGKVKADARKFDQKRDRFFYYKVWARYKKELKDFYIAVFSAGESHWIGDLLSDKYDKIYNDWLKRNQALTQHFRNDVEVICDFMDEKDLSFKDLLLGGDDLPVIVRLYQQDFICLETVVIINRLTKMTDKCHSTHPFWDDAKLLLTKYQSFVKVSKLGQFASILRDGIDKLG